MAAPIVFWFDFASPYAYFALDRLERLAEQHDRAVVWRPILLWAVLKSHNIVAPLDPAARRAYLLADMARSADFHGVVYRAPSRFPLSSHRAARLFHALGDGDLARAIGRDVFKAYFGADADISDPSVLAEIAVRHGLSTADALAAMEGEEGRRGLQEMNVRATTAGVCGSPWIVVDDEPFFGVDRLPQIAWRLSSAPISGLI